MRKLTFVAFLICCVPQIVLAQIERSAFTTSGRGVATTFVHDYQSIGINPANLAWTDQYDRRIALGLAEGGAQIYSEVLNRKELRDRFSGFDDELTTAQKSQFARDFADSDLSYDMDLQLIGVGVNFNDRGWGGIAFSVRDRLHYFSNLNVQASEILFLGWNADYFDQLQLDDENGPIIENTGNLSPDTLERVVRGISTGQNLATELFNGSQMKSVWYREFNLAYGREVVGAENWSLGAGVGLKYIQGISIIDIDVQSDTYRAIGATTPSFGIDYGTAAQSNPSALNPNDNSLPTSVGSGFGFDLGLNFKYKEKLKVGVAVNDIGSVNWNGNVYSAQDTIVFDIRNDGFNSLNVLAEAEKLSGKDGLFKQEGIASERIGLPTNLRLGASYRVNEWLQFGGDFFMSLNDAPGSFTDPIYGIGGDVEPFSWLRLSVGVLGGGNYATRMPIGITFIAGKGTWEAGVASRDLISYLWNDGSTMSASFGFLRFRMLKIEQPETEAFY